MVDVLTALREGLAPHYTVEREIGAGGMARVFLAVERHPPRKVAVKVMNPDVSSSEFRERFIREVELTSRLSHPHIVPILAADECLFVPDGPDGLCYYVMPYIEGESLGADWSGSNACRSRRRCASRSKSAMHCPTRTHTASSI